MTYGKYKYKVAQIEQNGRKTRGNALTLNLTEKWELRQQKKIRQFIIEWGEVRIPANFWKSFQTDKEEDTTEIHDSTSSDGMTPLDEVKNGVDATSFKFKEIKNIETMNLLQYSIIRWKSI